MIDSRPRREIQALNEAGRTQIRPSQALLLVMLTLATMLLPLGWRGLSALVGGQEAVARAGMFWDQLTVKVSPRAVSSGIS